MKTLLIHVLCGGQCHSSFRCFLHGLFLIFKKYLFIFGYVGSSWLHGLFLSCGERELLSSHSAQTSHLRWLLLLGLQ